MNIYTVKQTYSAAAASYTAATPSVHYSISLSGGRSGRRGVTGGEDEERRDTEARRESTLTVSVILCETEARGHTLVLI